MALNSWTCHYDSVFVITSLSRVKTHQFTSLQWKFISLIGLKMSENSTNLLANNRKKSSNTLSWNQKMFVLFAWQNNSRSFQLDASGRLTCQHTESHHTWMWSGSHCDDWAEITFWWKETRGHWSVDISHTFAERMIAGYISGEKAVFTHCCFISTYFKSPDVWLRCQISFLPAQLG